MNSFDNIQCEECENLGYVQVTPKQLPCAKYLFDNFWEGLDGTIYMVTT